MTKKRKLIIGMTLVLAMIIFDYVIFGKLAEAVCCSILPAILFFALIFNTNDEPEPPESKD